MILPVIIKLSPAECCVSINLPEVGSAKYNFILVVVSPIGLNVNTAICGIGFVTEPACTVVGHYYPEVIGVFNGHTVPPCAISAQRRQGISITNEGFYLIKPKIVRDCRFFVPVGMKQSELNPTPGRK
jgi:hypothetical protein